MYMSIYTQENNKSTYIKIGRSDWNCQLQIYLYGDILVQITNLMTYYWIT